MTTTDRAPKGAYDALRAAEAAGDAWETTEGWVVLAPAEGNLQREVRFPTRRMAAEAALAWATQAGNE